MSVYELEIHAAGATERRNPMQKFADEIVAQLEQSAKQPFIGVAQLSPERFLEDRARESISGL